MLIFKLTSDPILDGDANYIVAQDGSLMITDVDIDGSGLYKCRALNGIGEPVIKTYQLTVQGREWIMNYS